MPENHYHVTHYHRDTHYHFYAPGDFSHDEVNMDDMEMVEMEEMEEMDVDTKDEDSVR